MHYSSKYLFFTTRAIADGYSTRPIWYDSQRVWVWHTPWFYMRVGSWQ